MTTKLETAFQDAARKKVNLKECKECRFFTLEKNAKPHCRFNSTNITDCIIAAKQLHLAP